VSARSLCSQIDEHAYDGQDADMKISGGSTESANVLPWSEYEDGRGVNKSL